MRESIRNDRSELYVAVNRFKQCVGVCLRVIEHCSTFKGVFNETLINVFGSWIVFSMKQSKEPQGFETSK